MATHTAQQAAARAGRPAVSVADPVLAAKITAAGVPEWAVPRPRVTELIAQGSPLTVVTGPPGAGKTMAVASWAAAEPRAVAWVCLDRYDNRPSAFWSYVVAALRRSGIVMPRALSAAARGPATEHAFLLRLAAALTDQDLPVVLVLDDFHVLTEPKVLNGLDFVLRNAAADLRLVISSRMDPLLRLHRYRLAGELTEIRARDLAFDTAEAGLLMARHNCRLSADSLECLTQRTEGWAAGLRLAAISLDSHPDPDQFVKELITEDSALTSYLVEEVLNAQPPEARDVLLSTSILEQVTAEAASELTGSEQAAGILHALARGNMLIRPTGPGSYQYHPLFAEVLRLKLRHIYPDRMADLHQRAACLYERNNMLTEAVRHAAEAGDWQLAARMVIGGLAISDIIEPQDSRSLAEQFQRMPGRDAWNEPGPFLVSAALSLSAGQHAASGTALDAAEGILERLPADQGTEGRLAAAMIRLAASRRLGDLTAAAAAAAHVEVLVGRVSDDKLARHPEVRPRVLAARGAVELWSGHLDEAGRILDSGLAAATSPGTERERADCLAHLALLEAVRGRPGRAAHLAAQATADVADLGQQGPGHRPNPAALVALAWVHLERNELAEAHRLLKQADATLGICPDRLTGAVACLVAAYAGLAGGRADVVARFVAMARSGWCAPAWLEQRLALAESKACVAAGDIQAALAAASRATRGSPLEAAVVNAQAWAAAGDTSKARHALAPALAANGRAPEPVRLQAWLVDAQLNYASGDQAQGRRSLASALRLAEHEQLRMPFVRADGWLRQALRRDPELARKYQRLLTPALPGDQPPTRRHLPDQPGVLVVQPLTGREREVLRHFSGMLNTAEVASEMHISTNTVKTHLKSIYRKLAANHLGEAVRRARQLELI